MTILMYNKRWKIFTFILLLSLISSNVSLTGAEEDFDYDITYVLSNDHIAAGGDLAVSINLTGRYIADGPYSLDKQIEAQVELLLDGVRIGEGTVPAGPMEIIPYQEITISETIPGLVPPGTTVGVHELVVRSRFNALGYNIEETETFSIEVLEVASSGGPMEPCLYFSLSPLQMYFDSTSTLTLRVFNPNDSSMSTEVSLYSSSYGYESAIGSYEISLEAGGAEEIRRTFKLVDNDIGELCFIARLDWYEIDGERFHCQCESRQCAEILNRPSLRPNITFENYSDLGDGYFIADMILSLDNATEWERSLIVDELNLSIALPEELLIVEGFVEYHQTVRRDLTMTIRVKGPLEEYYNTRGLLEGTYVFGDPDETVEFTYPFMIPSTDTVRETLGLGPLMDGGQDDGSRGSPNLGITAFLIGGLSGGNNMDGMNEIFSYIDQLFQ